MEIGVERAAASEIILELKGFKGGKAIKRRGFRSHLLNSYHVPDHGFGRINSLTPHSKSVRKVM